MPEKILLFRATGTALISTYVLNVKENREKAYMRRRIYSSSYANLRKNNHQNVLFFMM